MPPLASSLVSADVAETGAAGRVDASRALADGLARRDVDDLRRLAMPIALAVQSWADETGPAARRGFALARELEAAAGPRAQRGIGRGRSPLAPYPEHKKPKPEVGTTPLLGEASDSEARRPVRDRAPSGRPAHRPATSWGTRFLASTLQPNVPRYGNAYIDPRGYCSRTGHEWLLECAGCGFVRMAVPCGQIDCRTCYGDVKNRRERRLVERMGGKPLRCFEFTFPGTWRKRLGVEALELVRARLVSLLKDWQADQDGLRAGWLVNFHPSGDQCHRHKGRKYDQCGCQPIWKPHFHVVSPAVGVRSMVSPVRDHLGFLEALAKRLKYTPLDDEARVWALPYKLPGKALDDLKLAWSAVLADMARELREPMPAVNVHYSFRTSEAKIAHRLGYDARPWPEWRAGGLPLSFAVPQVYGLLSPRGDSRVEPAAQDAYRELVRGGSPEPRPICCPFPGCERQLSLVSFLRFRSLQLRRVAFLPLLQDLTGEAAHGSAGPPGDLDEDTIGGLPAHPDHAELEAAGQNRLFDDGIPW